VRRLVSFVPLLTVALVPTGEAADAPLPPAVRAELLKVERSARVLLAGEDWPQAELAVLVFFGERDRWRTAHVDRWWVPQPNVSRSVIHLGEGLRISPTRW
jgi:hypothetical protein